MQNLRITTKMYIVYNNLKPNLMLNNYIFKTMALSFEPGF